MNNENNDKKKKMIRIGIIIAIPVIIGIIIFAFVNNSLRIDKIKEEIKNGNYTVAEELIDDYQKSNSSLAEPYELYAELYLAQGEPERAIEKLEEGLKRVSSGSKDDLQKQIDEIKSEYQITNDNMDLDANSSEEKVNSEETPATTEDPKVVEDNFKNSCDTIDFKTLSRNPDKYKGNKYKLTGEVIQVQEGMFNSVDLRINITKEEFEYIDDVMWTDTIYATITIPDGEDNILVDDIITFWGTCDGEYTYETVLGDSVTLPKIDIEYYVLGEQ